MVRLRLRTECGYAEMHTPFGTITKEFKDFPDNSYVYREVEVEGIKPIIKPEPDVSAPFAEAYEALEVVGLSKNDIKSINKAYAFEEDFIKALSENKVKVSSLSKTDIIKLKKYYEI